MQAVFLVFNISLFLAQRSLNCKTHSEKLQGSPGVHAKQLGVICIHIELSIIRKTVLYFCNSWRFEHFKNYTIYSN